MSLHVHSMYSALDSVSTPDEIADRMVEIGCSYCGLTDHGVVAGHLAFDKAMRKRNLKPVFGVELYHGITFGDELDGKTRDQAHLIALAMTDEGLRNLWRLVNATASRDRTHHVGRVTWDDLERYREGLVITSACPLGLVPQGLLRGDTEALNRYLDIFRDNFFMELTTYPGDADWSDMDADQKVTPRIINELVVEHAYERGVPLSIGDDGHYARRDQYKMHDLYLALQMRQSIYTPIEERKMWHPEGALAIKDETETRAALAYLPDRVVNEAIGNTNAIGECADAHLPGVERPHMPVFVPKDCPWLHDDVRNAEETFIDLVEMGIFLLYGGAPNEEEAWARAIHEMEVLMEDGLQHYFLMGWDVVRFCDENSISRGPGRGSSAGSIVAYALGITDVDPIHYDLYFERFWNKGRTDGFPDIDSDFARSKRGDIREYLIKRWGEKRVCSIGTITRLKPKAVVKRLGLGCEISYSEMNEVNKILDDVPDIEIHGTDQIGWSEDLEPGKTIYVDHHVGKQLEKWIAAGRDRESVRRTFIEMCRALCSRNEGYGIHPSGIVVSDIDLEDYAPAYLRGGKKEGVPATMFPMSDIEKLKLIKLDILGLKTLDTLAEWDELVKDRIELRWSGLDKQEWPDEMWDMLEDGFVAGIFQCETPGGKRLTTKMKPRSVDDLGVLVALNRPGPARAGVPARYFARRNGTEEVSYPHPMLEDILKPTYGLFVYQEQIIRFMGELGYTLGEADAVRKILGKKQPEKLSAIFEGFDEWDQKGFLKVATSKGFSDVLARKVWKDLEGFASYSFNKSHSIAYGIIAFRCLLAKFYAPAEFYTACIRTVDQQKRAELTPQYIKEARRLGIKVLPPDIRFSKAECAAHDGQVYFGFSDVKDVGVGGPFIVHLRDEMNFDVSSPESLCDALEAYNDEYLAEKKAAAKEGRPLPKDSKSPKQQINAKKINAIYEAGGWDGLGQRQISLQDKQKRERDYLGVILTDNTQQVMDNNDIEDCDDYEDALVDWEEKEANYDWDMPEDKRKIEYYLCGIVNHVRPTKTKKSGTPMGIVTIENGSNELEFVVFPQDWHGHKFLFKERNVGVFKINHTPRGYNFESGKLLK